MSVYSFILSNTYSHLYNGLKEVIMNIDYWEDKVDVFIENQIKLTKGASHDKQTSKHKTRRKVFSNEHTKRYGSDNRIRK